MKLKDVYFLSLQPNKTATVKLEANTEATKLQDSADITNLTAEIESFVRIADTDKEILESEISENETVEIVNSSSRQSPEGNDCYPQDYHTDEITIERIQNLGEMDENSECKTSPIKILIRAPTDEESTLNIDEEEEELKIGTTEYIDHAENENMQEAMKPDEDTDKTKDEIIEEIIIQDQNEIISSTELLTEECIAKNDASKDDTCLEGNELKITESSDDLTILTDKTTPEVCKIKECQPSSSRVSSILMNINRNESRKVPPTPPLRRRSVKEIIESINKCQSLLKINQDLKSSKVNNTDQFQTTTSSSPSKSFKNKSFFIDRNMNDTNEKDYQNKRLFTDMTEVNNNANTNANADIPLFVEKFNELNDNNSNVLFEKCVVQNDERESNAGSRWNPVPKPRRHRKE